MVAAEPALCLRIFRNMLSRAVSSGTSKSCNGMDRSRSRASGYLSVISCMTSNQFSSRRAVDEDWHAVTGRRAIRRGEVGRPLLQLLLRGWTLHSRSITLNLGEISFRRGYHALAMERVLVTNDGRRQSALTFVHLLHLLSHRQWVAEDKNFYANTRLFRCARAPQTF